jgi:hypothetical protein
MRVSRVQFTVRQIMVATVILALALGLMIEFDRERRVRAYLREADDCLKAEATWRELYSVISSRDQARIAAYWRGRPDRSRRTIELFFAKSPERVSRIADQWGLLGQKYLRAASRPWIPLDLHSSEAEWTAGCQCL